jgi:hypothetical protein
VAYYVAVARALAAVFTLHCHDSSFSPKPCQDLWIEFERANSIAKEKEVKEVEEIKEVKERCARVKLFPPGGMFVPTGYLHPLTADDKGLKRDELGRAIHKPR